MNAKVVRNRFPSSGNHVPRGTTSNVVPVVPGLGEPRLGTTFGNHVEDPLVVDPREPRGNHVESRSAGALAGPVGAFERYLWESRGGMWHLLDGQGGIPGKRP
jgi:hypothetical protein